MEQIIVTHKDGSTLKLQSRQYVRNIASAQQSVDLNGQDVVDLTVTSATKMNFVLGDKITVIGRDYTLNSPARERKNGERNFSYDLHFEGVQYDMIRASYNVNIDTTTSQIQDISGSSLTGDIERFLDVLISNLNRVFPGKWVLGTYPENTETKTLTFSDSDNCLTILQSLCSEDNYNTEFNIAIDALGVRTLNVGTSGKLFLNTFEYGKEKGTYELTREKLSSSNIITRLFAFGSSKNISTKNYRSNRLCLATKNKSQSFLENAESISKFGVWEATKVFEDIYPHRTGTVTALGASTLQFVDAAMDFDLNAKDEELNTIYLIPGSTAKIHFNTGNLAGYEFEISDYNHTTKTFTIVSQTDDNGYTFPSPTSAAFQFDEGDKYVILDIYLPQSYIDAAEAELAAKADEFLTKYCQPCVQYGISIDPFFLNGMVGDDAESNIVWPGDYMPVKDSDLDVDKTIRVKSIARDLLKDYSYSITISDIPVSVSTITRVVSDVKEANKVIKMNNLRDVAKARRNYLAAQEVLNMVFDTDGYFTDKIRPLSVETSMLAVGAKSMQFGMTGTIFQVNYAGQKNRIVYAGGSLAHYAILDENEDPRVWTITDGDVTLATDAAYYIYAKCSRSASSASILFSDTKILPEGDGAYYHFLIGVVNSVQANNERALSTMYGFTTVNGRFIKTGRLQSADGTTYFDLDTSEMGGKIFFKDGLVSGLIGVGPDSDNINAGMSGTGTADTDVRFWAGSTPANKETAPFRVLQNGKFYATNAEISGKITSTEGSIGGFTIASDYLTATDSNNNQMLLSASILRFFGGENDTEVYLGVNTISAAAGFLISPMNINVTDTSGSILNGNAGIVLSVSGRTNYDSYASCGNHALYILDGDIAGFRPRTRRIAESTTLSDMDNVILCVNTSTITLTLPSSPKIAQMYIIRRCASSVTISAGAKYLTFKDIANKAASYSSLAWQSIILHWDENNNIWWASLTVGM